MIREMLSLLQTRLNQYLVDRGRIPDLDAGFRCGLPEIGQTHTGGHICLIRLFDTSFLLRPVQRTSTHLGAFSGSGTFQLSADLIISTPAEPYLEGIELLESVYLYLNAYPIIEVNESRSTEQVAGKLSLVSETPDLSKVAAIWQLLGLSVRPSLYYTAQFLGGES